MEYYSLVSSRSEAALKYLEMTKACSLKNGQKLFHDVQAPDWFENLVVHLPEDAVGGGGCQGCGAGGFPQSIPLTPGIP